MRFVDSNIFIYHLAGDPDYGKIAGEILERIEREEKAATSTLVISQVCAYLKWKKAVEVIPVFIDLLRSMPSMVKEETTFLDIASAYALQEETEMGWKRWDDLVIASQMERLNIKEIYSNDRDFDLMPGIKRIFE